MLRPDRGFRLQAMIDVHHAQAICAVTRQPRVQQRAGIQAATQG